MAVLRQSGGDLFSCIDGIALAQRLNASRCGLLVGSASHRRSSVTDLIEVGTSTRRSDTEPIRTAGDGTGVEQMVRPLLGTY
jgi:hypothetical protein